MASNQTVLRKLLGSQTNDKSIMGQAIWQLISALESEEQIELLSICFTERNSVPKYEEGLKNSGLTNEEWDNLIESISDMIDAHLKNAFFNSRTVNEFSKQVLKLINFFDTENEKTYCLTHCIFSNYIPFHELPGEPLRLSNERFHHLLHSNNSKKDLIDYIVKLPFSSYTEAVSHVLHIVDSEKSQELRTSLLSYYIAGRLERLKRQLKD